MFLRCVLPVISCGFLQEVHKAREKFCAAQQPRIDTLWRFVQEQRTRRRQARFTFLEAAHTFKVAGSKTLHQHRSLLGICS